MALGRNEATERVPLQGLDVKVEAQRLIVATALLVEKINRGFKFTIGDRTMDDAFAVGKLTFRGMKSPMKTAADLRTKLDRLTRARSMLGDLEFDLEVAITACRVSPEEKAIWDIQFREVRRQLDLLVTSLSKRLAEMTGGRESSAPAMGEAEPVRDADRETSE